MRIFVMIVHSVDANLPAQTSAYAMAQAPAYSGAVATERPLTMLVASNDPVVPAVPLRSAAGPRATGVAPCSIQYGSTDAGEWGTMIAECNGRLVTVGRPSPVVFAASPDSSSRLLSVMLAALAALALLFAAQAFCGGRTADLRWDAARKSAVKKAGKTRKK
jgi:hypothetical protein